MTLGEGLSANLICADFSAFEYPTDHYDLINAQFSLPFCAPQDFARVFEQVTQALKPGGVFVGQFFGTGDSWANTSRMTFHTRAEVEQLLAPYTTLALREEKEPGQTDLGEAKFWHIYNIIARKK